MSWVRKCSNAAALSIALLGAAAARSEELPNHPCEAFGMEAGYVSPDDLRRVRSLRQDRTSAAFLGLREEDAPIIDEVLRVGPSAGFYAARLLRDLVLIDAFERQSQCDPKQACPKPEIIAGFSIVPGQGKSWSVLVDDWKGFRDRDASRSRACLEVARTLPTADFGLVTLHEPDRREQPRPEAQPQPPVIPEQRVVVVEPKLPEPLDVDFVCRTLASNLLADRQIYFSSGKSRVEPADRKFLTELAQSVAQCKSLRFSLVGHADSDGPRRYNERLSQQRAEAVATMLRTTGSIGLETSGMGESQPARPNTTKANKAYNRRVTIVIR